jgi:DNA-binding CsgD family transcriptional regulator
MLRGRSTECDRLDALLADVRSGRSRTLVVRGEAGVGKTALLDHLVTRADGCRIARAWGVESEMELAYAGLHQLCAPLLGSLDRLPHPQRDALHVVFGMSAADVPERFLVALAVLSLLADVAEDRGLVCVVDDAQWIDRSSMQALAFVARRLEAEPVALVFAEREPSDELTGLASMEVEGLDDHAAQLLLESAVHGRLDDEVRQRIVAETRGNPLALMELTRGLSPTEVAGGFGLPDARSLASRIEQSFLRQLHALPPDTQRLLLVAAAEPSGDATLMWRAAALHGIGQDAAAPAEAAGLLEVRARVRFRHPLVRSAVHGAAALADRQAVHRALAEATDPATDPDRRAWHRAQALAGPDEDVADELERSADRARSRGGVAAAAAFLSRATEATPEPARRSERALAAAQAMLDAAAPDAAAELLATAELGPLDELQQARLQRLRAHVAFVRRRGDDAPPLLLEAARRLAPLDAALARETYLEALGAAVYAGGAGPGRGAGAVAEAARAAPPAPGPPRALDLLLDGLTIRFTDGYAAAVAPLQQALQAFRRDDGADGPDGRDLPWLWLACRVAPELWDDESWDALTLRQERLARETGALTVLPVAASGRGGLCVHVGDFATAAVLVEEADTITEATGTARLRYTSLVLAAWRGREAEAMPLIEASVRDATVRGEGRAISLAQYATAVLCNGLGRYEDALEPAQRACASGDLGLEAWGLIELIEAGARAEQPELAAAAHAQLAERTRPAGTDWALGIEARSRALLHGGAQAEVAYREAIECLARTRVVVHLARAHLLYGEWLRREHRRVDARDQLRRAHDMFSRIGAEAFAERARRELLATGETVRKRTVETVNELTAQEAYVARLARDGRTNPEIGAQMFISPRTVEWHLSKVFTKLGIGSRRELRATLPDHVAHPAGT